MFLLFGGEKDFNIKIISKQLHELNIDHKSIIIQESKIPELYWDMNSDLLYIDRKPIKATSIFLRDDVFQSVTSNTEVSHSWHTTLRSWALIHDNISMFNKEYIGMNKAYNLSIAKSIGFEIPRTIITNQIQRISKALGDRYIIKPISGGKYTVVLNEYSSTTTITKKNHECVSFIQNKLIQPEMRIFGIGNSFFGFWIKSNLLDYRVDKTTQIIPCDAPKHLSNKLLTLMKKLKLNFAAADFKTCPVTKQLVFLEINSGPMFGRFDYESSGKLSSAMIQWHLQQNQESKYSDLVLN